MSSTPPLLKSAVGKPAYPGSFATDSVSELVAPDRDTTRELTKQLKAASRWLHRNSGGELGSRGYLMTPEKLLEQFSKDFERLNAMRPEKPESRWEKISDPLLPLREAVLHLVEFGEKILQGRPSLPSATEQHDFFLPAVRYHVELISRDDKLGVALRESIETAHKKKGAPPEQQLEENVPRRRQKEVVLPSAPELVEDPLGEESVNAEEGNGPATHTVANTFQLDMCAAGPDGRWTNHSGGVYKVSDRRLEFLMPVFRGLIVLNNAGAVVDIASASEEGQFLAPARDLLFQKREVPPFSKWGNFYGAEVELPLKDILPGGLVTPPGSVVTELSYYTADNKLLPHTANVLCGALGGAKVAAPEGAAIARYRLAANREWDWPAISSALANHIPYPRSYNPPESHAVMSLIAESKIPALRKATLIAEDLSDRFIPNDHPHLAKLVNGSGAARDEVIAGLQAGNCVPLNWHLGIQLLKAHVPALITQGLVPEAKQEKFILAPGHVQTLVVTEKGPAIFDLTLRLDSSRALEPGSLREEAIDGAIEVIAKSNRKDAYRTAVRLYVAMQPGEAHGISESPAAAAMRQLMARAGAGISFVDEDGRPQRDPDGKVAETESRDKAAKSLTNALRREFYLRKFERCLTATEKNGDPKQLIELYGEILARCPRPYFESPLPNRLQYVARYDFKTRFENWIEKRFQDPVVSREHKCILADAVTTPRSCFGDRNSGGIFSLYEGPSQRPLHRKLDLSVKGFAEFLSSNLAYDYIHEELERLGRRAYETWDPRKDMPGIIESLQAVYDVWKLTKSDGSQQDVEYRAGILGELINLENSADEWRKFSLERKYRELHRDGFGGIIRQWTGEVAAEPALFRRVVQQGIDGPNDGDYRYRKVIQLTIGKGSLEGPVFEELNKIANEELSKVIVLHVGRRDNVELRYLFQGFKYCGFRIDLMPHHDAITAAVQERFKASPPEFNFPDTANPASLLFSLTSQGSDAILVRFLSTLAEEYGHPSFESYRSNFSKVEESAVADAMVRGLKIYNGYLSDGDTRVYEKLIKPENYFAICQRLAAPWPGLRTAVAYLESRGDFKSEMNDVVSRFAELYPPQFEKAIAAVSSTIRCSHDDASGAPPALLVKALRKRLTKQASPLAAYQIEKGLGMLRLRPGPNEMKYEERSTLAIQLDTPLMELLMALDKGGAPALTDSDVQRSIIDAKIPAEWLNHRLLRGKAAAELTPVLMAEGLDVERGLAFKSPSVWELAPTKIGNYSPEAYAWNSAYRMTSGSDSRLYWKLRERLRNLTEGARLSPKQILMRHIAAGGGKVLVNGTGSGIFEAHRQYASGDDLKNLDWNLYARSGELQIKRFKEEENRRNEILVDMEWFAGDPATVAGFRKLEQVMMPVILAYYAKEEISVRCFLRGFEMRTYSLQLAREEIKEASRYDVHARLSRPDEKICESLSDIMMRTAELERSEFSQLKSRYPSGNLVDPRETGRFDNDIQLYALIDPRNRTATVSTLASMAMKKHMNVILLNPRKDAPEDLVTRVLPTRYFRDEDDD